MTRRTLLVIATVLVSFFTFAPTRPVGACVLDANDRCAQMNPPEQAAMFRAASAPVPFVNAASGPTVPQRIDDSISHLCTYPTVGLPPCFALQADGGWERSNAPVGASIIGAEPLSLSLSPMALPTEHVRPATIPTASVACAEVGPCDIP